MLFVDTRPWKWFNINNIEDVKEAEKERFLSVDF